MLKRNWALIALVYLAIAEMLSFTPVPDLALCLIQAEHSQQTADNDEKKYCPAFHTGVIASLDALDGFLEHHDKSVVGGFTIILAISTIGLWLATIKLWAAGEKQFGLLSESAAAQGVDMRSSIAAANRAAKAAEDSVDMAGAANERQLRAYVFISKSKLSKVVLGQKATISFSLKNTGQTPAFNVRMQSTIGFAPFPEHVPPNVDSHPFSPRRALAPQAEMNHNVELENPINQTAIRMLELHQSAIYVVGRVCYRDTFGKDRWTRFCFFGGGDLPINPDGTGAIAAFTVGNTSDDDTT